MNSSGDPHLLQGLFVAGLKLQNLLEAAAGRHGISQWQVAFALTQMTLWGKTSCLGLRKNLTLYSLFCKGKFFFLNQRISWAQSWELKSFTPDSVQTDLHETVI